jgi:hypothetical protein
MRAALLIGSISSLALALPGAQFILTLFLLGIPDPSNPNSIEVLLLPAWLLALGADVVMLPFGWALNIAGWPRASVAAVFTPIACFVVRAGWIALNAGQA